MKKQTKIERTRGESSTSSCVGSVSYVSILGSLCPKVSHCLVTCCLPCSSLSTQTLAWSTAAQLALLSCQPARTARRSWGCWGKPSTGDLSSLSVNLQPRASTMSSPGTIFTTKPAQVVVRRGTCAHFSITVVENGAVLHFPVTSHFRVSDESDLCSDLKSNVGFVPHLLVED